MKRNFNQTERKILYLLADGKCTKCGKSLKKSFHGDHIKAYSKGGKTRILNAQALCPECNLKKGDRNET